eukprot:GAFH01001602.1.p1 GENE.GAFH01001602.1~~GAFH01001602.1.p1  ORF type:complete len:287 (+),score=24.05 GAFH01001602.1:480-1340(+)
MNESKEAIKGVQDAIQFALDSKRKREEAERRRDSADDEDDEDEDEVLDGPEAVDVPDDEAEEHKSPKEKDASGEEGDEERKTPATPDVPAAASSMDATATATATSADAAATATSPSPAVSPTSSPAPSPPPASLADAQKQLDALSEMPILVPTKKHALENRDADATTKRPRSEKPKKASPPPAPQPQAYKPASEAGPAGPIVLDTFERPEDLLERYTAQQLKDELTRLGLKCGGTPFERARRLWAIRGLPKEKWDTSLLTGMPSHPRPPRKEHPKQGPQQPVEVDA